MQMVFHLGVHGTDGDRLLKTILANRAELLTHGTEVVTPRQHRGLMEEALLSLNGGTATPEMEQILLDAMLNSDAPRRVLMSTPTFLGAPGRAVGRDGLYPQIGTRATGLTNLFPQADAEFFLAIRNPATLISEVMKIYTGGSYDTLMQGRQPHDLRWREAIHRLVKAVPGRRIVIWCHEDVPMIWPEIARLIGALPPDAPLSGALVILHELLGDEGLAHLRKALAGRDRMTVAQRRAIHAQILQSHALPDILDQPIELPGWTQEMVDEVTRNYRADVAEIAVLPGVEFVFP